MANAERKCRGPGSLKDFDNYDILDLDQTALANN